MRIVFLIFFMFLLQGCLSTFFFGSVFMATKSIIDPRTLGRQIDDGTIETFLNIKISKDKSIVKKSRINPVVYDGKVLLIGQSSDCLSIIKAEKLAAQTLGVKEVFNSIKNIEPISLSDILLDIFMTVKIKFKILSNGLFSLSNIKVITENKEVFLFGMLTEKEGNIISKLVSKVDNVDKVITIFSYI